MKKKYVYHAWAETDPKPGLPVSAVDSYIFCVILNSYTPYEYPLNELSPQQATGNSELNDRYI